MKLNAKKIVIYIDLFVQTFLIAYILFDLLTIDKPDLSILMFLTYIGIWHILSALVWLLIFRDKKRILYFFIVLLFYVLVPIFLEYYFKGMPKSFEIIYIILNPCLLGLWYYFMTWQDVIQVRKTV